MKMSEKKIIMQNNGSDFKIVFSQILIVSNRKKAPLLVFTTEKIDLTGHFGHNQYLHLFGKIIIEI